jgi:hypothetical protein
MSSDQIVKPMYDLFAQGDVSRFALLDEVIATDFASAPGPASAAV